MLWKLFAADIEGIEGIGAIGAVLFLTSSCFFSIIISVILSTPDNFNLFLALGFLFQVQYLTLCNLLHNASILRKYGSICMGEKPRLFYNITEDVKARKANAFENFPAFDLIAFIVVVFYERNSDNGLICIPIVYKPFEIG